MGEWGEMRDCILAKSAILILFKETHVLNKLKTYQVLKSTSERLHRRNTDKSDFVTLEGGRKDEAGEVEQPEDCQNHKHHGRVIALYD